MKKCKYCDITNDKTRFYGVVCRKHYLQLHRHGKILERTIYDKNKIVEKEDHVEMELYDTKGEVKAIVIFDKDDIEIVSQYKWKLDGGGYCRCTVLKKMLHNFLTGNDMVDHINRNKLDNRRCNLRKVNKSENAMNSKVYCTSKTGIKGVRWYKAYKKWSANIMVNYKTIFLGYFNDIEDAKKARYEAELKYHTINGEKAYKEYYYE